MARRKGDFSDGVKQTLFREVNGHCAAPGCDKYTSAGKAGKPEESFVLGEAAHICAASPGGPRYDRTMSDEERESSSNGIWLCRAHAREIDVDPDRFTAQHLREWKRLAIERARSRIDTKPYRYQEAIDLVRQLLPIAGHTPLPLSGAIQELLRVTDHALQELDPRFIVQSDLLGGQRYVHLSPVGESVDLSIRIADGHVQEFWEKNQRLLDHAEPMTMPLDVVEFESPLFRELLTERGGIFSVDPVPQPALNTLELHHPTTGEVRHYESFLGQVRRGNQSMTFEGSTCGGLFVMSYQCLRGTPSTFPRMSIAIRLEMWEGRPLHHLPYLENAREIFAAIAEGWLLRTALKVEGQTAFSGELTFNPDQKAFFESSSQFLKYTYLCQQVAKRFGVEVQFKDSATYSLRQLGEMRTVLRLASGEKLEVDPQHAPDGLQHIIPTDAVLLEYPDLTEKGTETIVCTRTGGTLDLFGTKLPLPHLYVELTAVHHRYATEPVDKDRMRVHVRFERAADCRCFAYYDRCHWPSHLVPEGGFKDDVLTLMTSANNVR